MQPRWMILRGLTRWRQYAWDSGVTTPVIENPKKRAISHRFHNIILHEGFWKLTRRIHFRSETLLPFQNAILRVHRTATDTTRRRNPNASWIIMKYVQHKQYRRTAE